MKKPTKVKDLKGQVFGRMTVLEFHGVTKHNTALWLCQCECGQERVVHRENLIKGQTTSCGCFHREQWRKVGLMSRKPKGYAGLTRIFHRYMKDAKKRGYSWGLSRDQFDALSQQDCFYCGSQPNMHRYSTGVSEETRKNSWYTFNGIDRLDNNHGYSVGNCVPCCKHCNWAKRDRSAEDFFAWVEKVYASRRWA